LSIESCDDPQNFAFDGRPKGKKIMRRLRIGDDFLRRAGALAARWILGFACVSLFAAPTLALESSELAELLRQCSACHGVDGIAKDVEIPNLRGQHDQYVAEQLRAFRSGKRASKEMHYLSRHLTDEEIDALAQFYAEMPH
jgi:cytochrome c553